MRQDPSQTQAATPLLLRLIQQNLPIVTFLGLGLVSMLFVYWFFSPPTDSTAQAIAIGQDESRNAAPIFKAVPDKVVVQRLAQSPGPIRIGIISGHKESDSGAVCDDGLTEAEVNANIAELVAAQLTSQGIHTDILAEFDERLPTYGGTAVISIHADSCVYFNELATGYKIAATERTDSTALFGCIDQSYKAATNMFYHANTITEHMTDYHVFRKLPTGVPALIIEVGFMNLDREMLTTNAQIPAQGVANGILCYLNQVTQ
jgi:N-acetylmuramoyl-L-alanine amidase